MAELHQIGSYRVDALLGSGRFTDTYRAVDMVRKRTVALKVLKRELFTDHAVISRLLQAAQAAADLVHPHLAWVWEVGEVDGSAFLAERHVNGPSLAHILAQSGPLPWEAGLQMLKDILQGLDFAHARGWAHGAVTPYNILISPDLGAVLTDFGLTRALRSEGLALDAPLYTAPEVWQGGPVVPASDQYSLACTWAEAMLGMPLAAAADLQEVRQKHLQGLQVGSALPGSAAAALERALAVDPARRYSSAAEFAEAPAKLAAQTTASQDGRKRLEDEMRLWHAAQEQQRLSLEEAARQDALEKARLEIDEQIRRGPVVRPPLETRPEPRHPDVAAPPPVPAPPPPPAVQPGRRPVARRRRAAPLPWWRWLILVGILILVLVIAGLLLRGVLAPPASPTATPTRTALQPQIVLTSTSTSIPTQTATSTPAPTASSSPTLTYTQALTFTPTLSLTPTLTPTITLTSTPTRTPRIKDFRPSPTIRFKTRLP